MPAGRVLAAGRAEAAAADESCGRVECGVVIVLLLLLVACKVAVLAAATIAGHVKPTAELTSHLLLAPGETCRLPQTTIFKELM